MSSSSVSIDKNLVRGIIFLKEDALQAGFKELKNSKIQKNCEASCLCKQISVKGLLML